MKPKSEIIIYFNNTACVNGKFVGASATAILIEQFGLEPYREYDAVYNTPEARIVAFGKSVELFRITAERAATTRRRRRTNWSLQLQ